MGEGKQCRRDVWYGFAGLAGLAGLDGLAGLAGLAGLDGLDGLDGLAGLDGLYQQKVVATFQPYIGLNDLISGCKDL